jgi:hypothetical protein
MGESARSGAPLSPLREAAGVAGRAAGRHAFGTAPVFLASISTILGAVMFLRFGYAVGHVGLVGALAIIALGHLVTIPTALAIAEIATNRRVEGGGEYYIISRSFGLAIGGAIGIALYLSRTAGASKKGHNLLYGLRYGRVVVGTWLRERARRRRQTGRARRAVAS